METSLTQRQRQILDLLRAGKVNKEIANDLGIGLGTVKQHVVALFKKLKVKNRAAAISRGFDMQTDGKSGTAAHFTGDGLLEHRPCIVLSVVLPETADEAASRHLHQTLAAFAFDHDALFLARKGRAGDLIFGIQRATECDLFLALRAAHVCALAVDACAAPLRGALTAATVVASMKRHGGWSGEAIASTAIAQARELARGAAPGALALGPSARDLMLALSPCAPALPPTAIALRELDRLPWREGPEEAPPLGRDAELAQLDTLVAAAVQGDHRLAYLEGETGMGKSRLCRHVAAQCRRHDGRALHFVCAPDVGEARVYTLPDGATASLDAIFASLAAPAAAVIVDEAHLLPAADLVRLTQAGRHPHGRLVLIAARRLPEAAARPDAVIRLGRLAPDAVAQLAARTLGPDGAAPLAAAVAKSATGVPLFAVELARHCGAKALPLSLRIIVGARMDRLGLDLVLLRRVARAAAALDAAALIDAPEATPGGAAAALDQAIACGVLQRDERNRVSFKHPLLRQAVAQAQVL